MGKTGKQAWWIGPENHKARIDLVSQPRTLDPEVWETSQGDTAEVGVGALVGLEAIDDDEVLADKLISNRSLELAGIEEDIVEGHFFDLTAHSEGVLASVRAGHLKKDLSLLFEKEKASLPDRYRFHPGDEDDPGDFREPSIRPMSSEIADKAVLNERHFAPWNRMRHFYRMYRQDSDEEAPIFDEGGVDGSPGLNWGWLQTMDGLQRRDLGVEVGRPGCLCPVPDSHAYHLHTQSENQPRHQEAPGQFNLRYVASPVYVYWNPYNRGAARAGYGNDDENLPGTGAPPSKAGST